jgi:nucleoside-diphosphate-sugar epimerase
MMRALVTGAAGFVGSHLCEKLLSEGAEVVGVDAFTDYYDVAAKRRNAVHLQRNPRFVLVEGDLAALPLARLVARADTVFHLAGQPGVRASWGNDFGIYVHHNVVATHRLLEACKEAALHKLVYASSSSVYGDSETYPTAESLRPAPVSPYGVTKLAAEHLTEVYRRSFGVPAVSLRLFTVYGPRQRPDMAFARLVRAGLTGATFDLYGDGEQTRDFTYVGDVVAAMVAAAGTSWCGVANIGGGSRTSMNRVLEIVRGLCGGLEVRQEQVARGDVRHTAADTSVAAAHLGYRARTPLAEGLAAMVAAERAQLTAAAS